MTDKELQTLIKNACKAAGIEYGTQAVIAS